MHNIIIYFCDSPSHIFECTCIIHMHNIIIQDKFLLSFLFCILDLHVILLATQTSSTVWKLLKYGVHIYII